MRILVFFLACYFLCVNNGFAQSYPSFGPEKPVTITGLTFDAMEPFISADGQYLFFNNINDGINTRLYYASRVNDSTFTLQGQLNGTNRPSPPHLDAVADMDSLNNFFWTSDSGYPGNMDNLFHGVYNSGSVTNIGRVHGDFYIYSPGWIIMDHGINPGGNQLYFNNAYFNNCSGPCKTYIGVAQKVNDSTFMTMANSAGIMANINDTSFIYYAPCLTKDDLEFYYTRFKKGPVTASTVVEICTAVRSAPTDTFSVPKVLFSETVGNIIEAPTLTSDKQIMYYHKKESGTHVIKMRRRLSTMGMPDAAMAKNVLSVFPNPATNSINISVSHFHKGSLMLVITGYLGRTVKSMPVIERNTTLSVSGLTSGMYFVRLMEQGQVVETERLVIE